MTPSIYGLMAEYKDANVLLDAANRAREAGYKNMEAYTPLPVHGLAEAIGFDDAKVPWTIFVCGLAGAAIGFGFQAYLSAVAYPLNVGGRPLVSWPSFIPVTFECTILLAAFGAVFGMLAFNGLPRPHHPVFNAPRFELASQDRFFLCIEAEDPKFDAEETGRFLKDTGANLVSEVPYN